MKYNSKLRYNTINNVVIGNSFEFEFKHPSFYRR